jgi:hypothetical protein
MLKCECMILLVTLVLGFVAILMKMLPLNLPVSFFLFWRQCIENYDTNAKIVDFEMFPDCYGCVCCGAAWDYIS